MSHNPDATLTEGLQTAKTKKQNEKVQTIAHVSVYLNSFFISYFKFIETFW